MDRRLGFLSRRNLSDFVPQGLQDSAGVLTPGTTSTQRPSPKGPKMFVIDGPSAYPLQVDAPVASTAPSGRALFNRNLGLKRQAAVATLRRALAMGHTKPKTWPRRRLCVVGLSPVVPSGQKTSSDTCSQKRRHSISFRRGAVVLTPSQINGSRFRSCLKTQDPKKSRHTNFENHSPGSLKHQQIWPFLATPVRATTTDGRDRGSKENSSLANRPY